MSLFALDAAPLLSALALVVLALAHSVLGEQDILQPLFSASETMPDDSSEAIPNWARNRMLRFAWHLTSLAWLALAAIAIGVSPVVSVAVVCFASAGLIFWAFRGHFAWPIFLVAGFAALANAEVMSSDVARGLGWLVVTALVAAAGLHLYWVVGGRRLADKTIPTRGDGPALQPPRWMTLAVAAALIAQSVLLGLGYQHLGLGPIAPLAIQVLAWVGVTVLVARALGDRQYVGFSKTVRDTVFAQADEQYFTPLITIIALFASVALLAG